MPYYEYSGDYVYQAYLMDTYKASGSLSTPWYGEPFDADKFEYAAYYDYYINFPRNIIRVRNSLKNKRTLFFILHFDMVVSFYPGLEQVSIQFFNENGDELSDERFLSDIVSFPLEYLTGNVSVIKKYNANQLNWKDYVHITFNRKLNKEVVDKSFEKKNTGFKLTWYYEDSDGNNVKIKQKSTETDTKTVTGEGMFVGTNTKRLNQKFVTFLNFVYEAVTNHNVSFASLWDTARDFRIEFFHRAKNGQLTSCGYRDETSEWIGDIEYGISFITFALNISFTEDRLFALTSF